jgi:ATP-dependent exoDNAse (exonuclease V) beta subunit
LGEEQNQTLWQDEVLTDTLKPDGGPSLEEYRAWQAERENTVLAGARPEVAVFLASQAAEGPPRDAGVAVEVEFVSAGPADRKALGRRFGSLVHAALRDVGMEASAESLQKIVELNARVLGATAEETVAATEAVRGALRHPLFERARAAERCHREYPVTLRLENGMMLEGVVDLAFVEQGAWVVVDFKTDADPGDRRAQYARQLGWYAYVLAKLTGMRARGVLLGV